mmetsp:Transcript_556/g.3933  ORF Transcript_556/g.3933 Transcript_556/m.3933 type:complete len:96 (-) Transcript_556:3822-4109(-)
MPDPVVERPSAGRLHGLKILSNMRDYLAYKPKYRRNAVGLRSKDSSLFKSKIHDTGCMHLRLNVRAVNECLPFFIPCLHVVEIQCRSILNKFIFY